MRSHIDLREVDDGADEAEEGVEQQNHHEEGVLQARLVLLEQDLGVLRLELVAQRPPRPALLLAVANAREAAAEVG